MPLPNTREQLLWALRVHGPQTAAALSQRLGIGVSAVRQHLDHLHAEGVVEANGLHGARGRPKHLFALTAKADSLLPQQYESLVLDLLEAITRLPGGARLLRRILASRREILDERLGWQLAGKTLAERLAWLTAYMNERGSMAECTAAAAGQYVLTKNHCSVGAAAALYPVFCQEEESWLAGALQVPVEMFKCRATGDDTCAFRVGPPERRSGSSEKGA